MFIPVFFISSSWIIATMCRIELSDKFLPLHKALILLEACLICMLGIISIMSERSAMQLVNYLHLCGGYSVHLCVWHSHCKRNYSATPVVLMIVAFSVNYPCTYSGRVFSCVKVSAFQIKERGLALITVSAISTVVNDHEK